MVKFARLVFFVCVGISNMALTMDPAPSENNDTTLKKSVPCEQPKICEECLKEIKQSLEEIDPFLVTYKIKKAKKSCEKSCFSRKKCKELIKFFDEIPCNYSLSAEISLMIGAIKEFSKELEHNFYRIKYFLNKKYFSTIEPTVNDLEIIEPMVIEPTFNDLEAIEPMVKVVWQFSKRFEYKSFDEELKKEYLICACDILLSKQKIQPTFEDPLLIIFDRAFAKLHAECLIPFEILLRIMHPLAPIFKDNIPTNKQNKVSRKKRGSSSDNCSETPKSNDNKKSLDLYANDKIIPKLNRLLSEVFSHECLYHGKRGQITFRSKDMLEATKILKSISASLEKYFSDLKVLYDSQLTEDFLHQHHQFVSKIQ